MGHNWRNAREKEKKQVRKQVGCKNNVCYNIWKLEVSKYFRLKGMKVSITKTHSDQQYLNIIHDSKSPGLWHLGKK
jgi:hypothetical protein